MDDVELFALGTMTNSSQTMFDRRRRILHEARRMIGECGIGEFNIRELSRRAEVSSRTIYNAFGGKENVIALAIRAYFDSFHALMTFRSDASLYSGAIERLLATTLRNLQIPNYIHAVASLYFSPTLDNRIRKVLLEIGAKPWLIWLRTIQLTRQLEQWVQIDRLVVDLSDLQYAKVHEWGLGALSGDAFLRSTVDAVSSHLLGTTRGEARMMVRRTLLEMHADTTGWRDATQGIQCRLEEMREKWRQSA
jgi:AcrR family transcriptional regulator